MTEFERTADEMEGHLEDMERASRRVEERIDDTRADWQRKQADPNVPGADQPDDDQLDRRPPPDEMQRQGPG